MIEKIKAELKTWKNDIIGLDIETFTLKNNNKWTITPFEIGLYNKSKKKGLTFFVNPFYHFHLNKENDIMKFYKPKKYVNIEGIVLNLKSLQGIFTTDLQFKVIYGHNLLKFDLQHLSNFKLYFKANYLIDTYLMIGDALPLKYYTTLTEWHTEKMIELERHLKETNKSIAELTDAEKRKFFKFFTEKGNLKMTAESIYCFISNNKNFTEKHTALKDAEIEAEIYDYIIKRIGKRNLKLNGNWLTVLLEYFSKFKKTSKISESMKEKFKYQLEKLNDSYTKDLIQQYLVSRA
jgi:DNA polymerase III epsilon subunit-like protein